MLVGRTDVFSRSLLFGATYLYMICESLRCINMLILCMGIVLVGFSCDARSEVGDLCFWSYIFVYDL